MSVVIRKRLLKNGSTSLYLDYYDRGRRTYEFLKIYLNGDKTSDKEKLRLAEIVRNQREIDLFAGKHNILPDHRKREPFVEYARAQIAKRNRSNGDALLAYLSSFFGTTPIVGVDDRLLEEFQEYLKSKGLKSSSIESYLNVIGAVLSQAVRERYLSENPLKLVRRVRAEEPILEHLTIEELERLARTPIMGEKNLGGKIKRAFLFCCQTGLRWSDVRSLNWCEIKADASGNYQIAKRQVKTREPVYIPLSADAWGIINDGQDHAQEALVFGIESKSDPNQYLISWGKAAGIRTSLYFHLSRHTAATLLLEKGVDVAVVQKILGHTKIEMTLRYAKVTNQLKRQAVDSLKMNLGSGEAIDKATTINKNDAAEGQPSLAAKDN